MAGGTRSEEDELISGLNTTDDWQRLAEFLWSIIDDIDTASDVAKGNNVLYRTIVEGIQGRRWKCGVRTDGYTLDWSGAVVPHREDRIDGDGVGFNKH